MAKTTTTTTTPRNTTRTQGPPVVVNGLVHIELPAKDAPKLRKFLEKCFDWKFETNQMPGLEYHMFQAPNGVGGGVFEAQKGDPIQAVPYIAVQDCAKTARECEKNGAKIITPVTPIPNMGTFFKFQVPGGPILACWDTKGANASRN